MMETKKNRNECIQTIIRDGKPRSTLQICNKDGIYKCMSSRNEVEIHKMLNVFLNFTAFLYIILEGNEVT
jgi:hypothetical protein